MPGRREVLLEKVLKYAPSQPGSLEQDVDGAFTPSAKNAVYI